jgi:hypothetical protein
MASIVALTAWRFVTMHGQHSDLETSPPPPPKPTASPRYAPCKPPPPPWVGQITGAVKCRVMLVSDLILPGHGQHSGTPWLLFHSLQPMVPTLAPKIRVS